MLKRTATIVGILSISSFLLAGTGSIGSVVSQGDLRIDSRPVRTSGTIFDGSLVETGNGAISSADVRLNGNVRLTLYSDSRGTVYHDHLVLQNGQVEVASAATFRTEATGLQISTSEPHTTGMISIGRDGVVNISAQAGSFHVAKDDGLLLAEVTSHKPLAFFPETNRESWGHSGSKEDFGRDYHRCYIDYDDDRDCDHHHHRHPSK